MRDKTHRVIDANLNRTREGLRVCEDITRFVLENPALTKKLKSIRLSVTNIEKKLAKSNGFRPSRARNSLEDIGRASSFDPGKRKSFKDIFSANIRRSQESFRVLEEFSKLISTPISNSFKNLRFKTYTLEKDINEKLASVRNTGHPRSRR